MGCKIWSGILALVILILSLWPSLLGTFSGWIVVIAAIILVIHSFWCPRCGNCECCAVEEKPKKSKRK